MAVTVLVQGDVSKAHQDRRFQCPFCGCQFKAAYGDYELMDLEDFASRRVKAACECPTCGETAYSYSGAPWET